MGPTWFSEDREQHLAQVVALPVCRTFALDPKWNHTGLARRLYHVVGNRHTVPAGGTAATHHTVRYTRFIRPISADDALPFQPSNFADTQTLYFFRFQTFPLGNFFLSIPSIKSLT
uniref:hypothetical protein n=1 Tax=Salmonella enterica TaxID=28901 RepID=UPI00398C4D8A